VAGADGILDQVGYAWIRPYAPGTGRWWVLGWEAFSFAVLGVAIVATFDLDGHAVPLTVLAMTAVWLLAAWRIARMGVYVGDGLQIRGLLRTRTLRWDETRFWLHSSSHRVGPFVIPSGLTVLAERRNGSVINTQLWAKGVDFHARPHTFRAVYHELRDRHLAATRPGARPTAA
jgi:hypothetical protein